MPHITDQAICIRHWDFSETSQTVSLFTREHGVIRGLAKGAKREKGDFSGGIDVLTRGQIVAIVKPGRDLATLTQWSLQEMYRVIRTDLRANRAAIYMADLIHHMVREADAHPLLFDALCQALDNLAQPDRVDTALLQLQWAVLAEAGYKPELHKDANTGQLLSTGATFAFSASAGGLVADNGEADRWRVRAETVDMLRAIERNEHELPNEPTTQKVISRANRLLASYIRDILGSEPPAMRWAFSDLRR
jgi:DNA repair protein RecO (recombination protein O)